MFYCIVREKACKRKSLINFTIYYEARHSKEEHYLLCVVKHLVCLMYCSYYTFVLHVNQSKALDTCVCYHIVITTNILMSRIARCLEGNTVKPS